MDSSCIDEVSGESEKLAASQPSMLSSAPPPPLVCVSKLPAVSSCQKLQRHGSGASMVLDPDGGMEAESRKLPSSQYKGVVAQPNGRWGAQIYEKHQRVWLGTFNEEAEAGQAYDVAAQRFRGREAVTNFKPLSDADDDGAAELLFLSTHSKAEIVDMLRKHTYHDELQQSMRAIGPSSSAAALSGHRNTSGLLRSLSSSAAREQLFDKAVTPSDVGKLNRLVIPKQHAEKHFPLHIGDAACKGVLLNFEDPCCKVWRFRYSYWNSSQSYVLTKGWSRFVKEKNLKAGDIVSFQRSTGPDRQLYIDWKTHATGSASTGAALINGTLPMQPMRPGPVMRLFGVNIVKVSGGVIGAEGGRGGAARRVVDGGASLGLESCGGKKSRETEFLPLPQLCKKQCVEAL